MNPLTREQWSRLYEIVRDESREAAINWLRGYAFLPREMALSCILLAEDQVLMGA